jgi:hypothetical protein
MSDQATATREKTRNQTDHSVTTKVPAYGIAGAARSHPLRRNTRRGHLQDCSGRGHRGSGASILFCRPAATAPGIAGFLAAWFIAFLRYLLSLCLV